MNQDFRIVPKFSNKVVFEVLNGLIDSDVLYEEVNLIASAFFIEIMEKNPIEMEELYVKYKESYDFFYTFRHISPHTFLNWVKISDALVQDTKALFFFSERSNCDCCKQSHTEEDCASTIAYLIYKGVDENERNSSGKTWREIIDDKTKVEIDKKIKKIRGQVTKKAKGLR